MSFNVDDEVRFRTVIGREKMIIDGETPSGMLGVKKPDGTRIGKVSPARLERWRPAPSTAEFDFRKEVVQEFVAFILDQGGIDATGLVNQYLEKHLPYVEPPPPPEPVAEAPKPAAKAPAKPDMAPLPDIDGEGF